MDCLHEAGMDVLLDISVRADLTYYYKIWSFGRELPIAAVPTLRMNYDAAEQMRLAAAEMHLLGLNVNPAALYAQAG
eukprot:5308456-Pyramimonas_sp.AAC.1